VNTSGLVKYTGALLALAICAACGGSAVGPSSSALSGAYKYVGKTLFVNGRPVTAAHLRPMPRYATLVPDHHARKKFEYIFNDYETYASIFDYPKSVQQIGSIYGDGGQGCTNVLYGYGNKTFWNIGGSTQITEYKVPPNADQDAVRRVLFPIQLRHEYKRRSCGGDLVCVGGGWR
jgi:hypothetical protein